MVPYDISIPLSAQLLLSSFYSHFYFVFVPPFFSPLHVMNTKVFQVPDEMPFPVGADQPVSPTLICRKTEIWYFLSTTVLPWSSMRFSLTYFFSIWISLYEIVHKLRFDVFCVALLFSPRWRIEK